MRVNIAWVSALRAAWSAKVVGRASDLAQRPSILEPIHRLSILKMEASTKVMSMASSIHGALMPKDNLDTTLLLIWPKKQWLKKSYTLAWLPAWRRSSSRRYAADMRIPSQLPCMAKFTHGVTTRIVSLVWDQRNCGWTTTNLVRITMSFAQKTFRLRT